MNVVRKMKFLEGSVLYTGFVLDFVRNNLFISAVGYRVVEGVFKILVLIIGGKFLDGIS